MFSTKATRLFIAGLTLSFFAVACGGGAATEEAATETETAQPAEQPAAEPIAEEPVVADSTATEVIEPTAEQPN
ncbi:MAG: hypothetical protein ACFCUH_07675 [Flavobacteriales bacterium]